MAGADRHAVWQAVGDDLVDSIISDNIPVLTEQEKFNETAVSSVQRLAAKLRGQPVPAAPQRADSARQRTYKTKARFYLPSESAGCSLRRCTSVQSKTTGCCLSF